jgi:hypothetical protein
MARTDAREKADMKPSLTPVFLRISFLVLLAHVHQSRHVDLVEGGERSSGVLRLLQALGDTQTHAVHLDLYQICQF